MQSLHKLTEPTNGGDVPIRWPRVFRREATHGGERLVVAVGDGACDLLAELSDCLGDEFFVLYVLVVPRGPDPAGRYQSPLLERADVRRLLVDHAETFERDGRHHVWLHSTDGSGTLVYDRHDIVYAYGALEDFEAVLRRRGYGEGRVSLDRPHAHHYHAACDGAVGELLGRWPWRHSELQPDDE